MHEKFMKEALIEAKKSLEIDEVPIGAVIVKNDKILARAHNLKNQSNSSLAHAEIIAINIACKKLQNWRLNDCDIYITLEPCPMCASAIKQARIKNVFSACENSYTKNFDILNLIFKKDSTNSEVNFITNLDVEKTKKILSDFFKKQRK